jgi:hypothetical protein
MCCLAVCAPPLPIIYYVYYSDIGKACGVVRLKPHLLIVFVVVECIPGYVC